jgi:hypothetical protein
MRSERRGIGASTRVIRARLVLALVLGWGTLVSQTGLAMADDPVGSALPTIESASVVLEPDTVGAANVRWTMRLAVPYCGGPNIGDYLSVRFLAPLSPPGSLPAGSLSFGDAPADGVVVGDTLRVTPQPDALPLFCLHDRPINLALVVSPDAGLANPSQPGTYAVEVSTADNPTALRVPVPVGVGQDETSPPTGPAVNLPPGGGDGAFASSP